MNPHAPTERPGAHLVTEEFGVESPWTLAGSPHDRGPSYALAREVAVAADSLDAAQRALTDRAQSAIDLLEQLCENTYDKGSGPAETLPALGQQIARLATRRGAAYDYLTRTVSSYLRALTDPGAAAPSQEPDLGPGPDTDQVSEWDDDWAVSVDRKLRALEAVEAGTLRFHQSAVYGYVYLSDGGRRPTTGVYSETVQRLLADGLLERDVSEGLYRPGQRLSLTPEGAAALRDTRPAISRTDAALSRSSDTGVRGHTSTDTASASHGAPQTPRRTRPR